MPRKIKLNQVVADSPPVVEIETKVETKVEIKVKTKHPKTRRPTLSDTIPAIPVAAFKRLAREISEDRKSDMRWEGEALEALQVDAEAYLIGKFQKAKRTLDLFGKSGTVGDKMLQT